MYIRTECIYTSTHYPKILKIIWLMKIYFCARGICEVFKFYHIVHIHLKKNVLFQVHAFTCKCSCRVSSVAIIVKIKCQTPISSQNNGNRYFKTHCYSLRIIFKFDFINFLLTEKGYLWHSWRTCYIQGCSAVWFSSILRRKVPPTLASRTVVIRSCDPMKCHPLLLRML